MKNFGLCLIYKEGAEEAAKFYVKTFKGGKLKGTTYYGKNEYGQEGTVRTVNFEIFGQEFIAVNGGEYFKFTEGISLIAYCKTQTEIDKLWSKILKGGGKESQCGWITDKWGVSWQITPVQLAQMMKTGKEDKINKMTLEMYKMKKLDIKRLKKAFNS